MTLEIFNNVDLGYLYVKCEPYKDTSRFHMKKKIRIRNWQGNQSYDFEKFLMYSITCDSDRYINNMVI